jgi:2-methylcitrate dehydratase
VNSADNIKVMDGAEKRLVDFADALSFAELEPELLHAIKQRFIDTIGCALGAFREESSEIARRIAVAHSSADGVGVLGTSLQSSPELAAFANTAMIRCLDLNDDYFGKDGPHPSDMIGALLAAAESTHADGRTFVVAMTVAYEILCTLVDAVGLRDKGWDYVGFTAIAAALGTARLMKLSPEETRHALSLAAVPNWTLGQTRLGELSMWKGLASANACRNAVFACTLAREGISGPYLSFEGKSGVTAQITGPLDLSALGRHPLRAGVVYLKSWPVFYSGQASVQAALALRAALPADQIEWITIESYSRLLGRGASDREKWAPKSRGTADHSVAFCVAAALLDGEVTAETFEAERFLDADAIALMAKIELREDPEFTRQYPEVWNCRITAKSRSGKRHQVHVTYPKGHPKSGFTDAEVEAKFLRLAGPLLGEARCKKFFDWAWRLEEVATIGEIFSLVAI